MGIPAYVNSGNIDGNSGASIAVPLMGSRVNNNVMIAHVAVFATGKTIAVSGGGGSWTIGDSVNTASTSAAWAWRLVDGSESNPTFSWTGNAANAVVSHQFSGNATPTPVGAFANKTADGSTTLSSNSIVSTADNSLLVDLVALSNGQATNVLNRTHFYDSHGFGITILADGGPINLSGSTTDTLSLAVSSCNWATLSFEILGTGTGTAESIRSSQVVIEVPETYSDPVLAARASQVVLEVPETYSTPVMAARVSQVMAQILRTQSISAALVEPANATDVISSVLHPGPGIAAAEIHRKIRDPWDCDEFGRFQPGACIRPIY